MSARGLRVGFGFGPKTLQVSRTFLNVRGMPVALRKGGTVNSTLSVAKATVPVAAQAVNLTLAGSFSTAFPATENPISQGSKWTNGASVGLDWTNVQSTPGLAFATQTQHAEPPYDDSIACLSGFPADQWCQGVIHNVSAANREVELLLRATITAHSATLYEIDITQSNGLDIAIWNGPQNSFNVVVTGVTAGVSLADGAVWYAQIVGNVITVKCNGSTVATYTDTANTYTSGNPGIGFYGDTNAGTPSANNTLGFSSFQAGHF